MTPDSNSVVGLALVLASLSMLTRAQVQFASSVYTVGESMASVEVCVVVGEGILPVNEYGGIISTEDGTAVASSDYIAVSDHQLIFSVPASGDGTNCIHISITDDDDQEPEEKFSVLLTDSFGSSASANTTIYIIDDDMALDPSMTPTAPSTTTSSTTPSITPSDLPPSEDFSFVMESYSTVESNGSIEVCVQAPPGFSGSITAQLALEDREYSTATGNVDFVIPTDGRNLHFGNGRSLIQCGVIEIIDDEEPELTETFLIALVGTGVDPASTVEPTVVVLIIDDDYLECAEDMYIITDKAEHLTVCVVPVLPCIEADCTDVVVQSVGITTVHSIEVLAVEDTTLTAECAKITFSSMKQFDKFNIIFIKRNKFLNSDDNTKATCRVRVISSNEVPILSFEHEQYFVREGEPLQLCGFLFNINEFEPAESLAATIKNDNGDTVTLNYNGNSSYFDENSGVAHPAIKYCGTAVVFSNMRPERFRHLYIELSGPGFNVPDIQPLPGFSEVIVADSDGPNVECFGATNSALEPNDLLTAERYCFQDLDVTLDEIRHCYYNKSETDCTHWTPDSYIDLADNSQLFLQNYLSSLCPDGQQTLFELLYSRPSSPDACNTQCAVLIAALNDNPSCPSSVLLMDTVLASAAFEISGEMILEGCQDGQDIVLQISCCDRSLPEECFEGTNPPFSQEVIIGSAVGGAVVLVLGVLVLVLAVLLCCRRHRGKHSIEKSADDVDHETARIALENPNYQPIFEPGPEYEVIQPTQRGNVDRYAKWRETFASVIVNPHALQLKTQEMLGEGAFGQVHKGSLITSQEDISTQVAIKSLKNSPTEKEVDNFIAESAIMLDFSHPNVMKLVGVCFDTEDGLPLIILPYMANGDLKTFLATKRSGNDGGTLVSSKDKFPPGLTDAILSGMCLDIAKGMEYLSRSKFVHRDLAARNCMVDEKLQVSVADFGLSKDVYSSDYYRLTHAALLPVKWMAPEIFCTNVYNEKTDIWSFGVVCWEVFSLGQVPFPGLDNADIPDYISRGHRLRQPSLCPDEMNDLMQSTWNESPKERPTFLQLVHSLANILGQDISHEYFVLAGPQREAVEAEYDAVTFSNTPNGTSASGLHSLFPEEYEVPVPSRPPTPSKQPLSSSTHNAPEYANLLSQCSTVSSELYDREEADSPNQTHPHIYHVLEQPVS